MASYPVDYELPHVFEPFTKFHEHKHYNAPCDVLEFLRDEHMDVDATLVLAFLMDDVKAVNAAIEAGGSADAQTIAILRNNHGDWKLLPAIRDDNKKKILFELFMLYFYLVDLILQKFYRTRTIDDNNILREKGIDILGRQGSLRGTSILEFMVLLEEEELFDTILEHGVEEFELDRALMQAAFVGNPVFVKKLLEHGADANASRAGKERSRKCSADIKTPLTMVCFSSMTEGFKSERLDIARMLIEAGADAAYSNSAALVWTFQTRMFEERHELADMLISAGADITNKSVQRMAFLTKQGAEYFLKKTKAN